MESAIRARGRFERASFARHLAICVAAVVAYFLQARVHPPSGTPWILGITAVVNVMLTVVPDRPNWTRFSLVVSPCVGLAGWAVLVSVTGGVSSPFIVGFWLEIKLSAWTCSAIGTLLVTAGAVAALWAQQLLLGGSVPFRPLALQSGFLFAMGGITLLVTRQWVRTQSESGRRHAGLVERLRGLEGEIDALRVVGEVGANVAVLAHAVKNAVHSLRGFATLIDPRDPAGYRAEVFEGLRAAIDRLEEIARVTLGGRARGVAVVEGSETRRVIDEAIDEVAIAYPNVGWRRRVDVPLPAIHVERSMLREALLNVTRNAAESMGGVGEIAVETVVEANRFEIRVRDHGSGLTEEDLRRSFKPGFTTKPGGSGFGLYLTRRVVEACGGRLTATCAGERGTVISVELPRGLREPS